jgi:hypothetical protein
VAAMLRCGGRAARASVGLREVAVDRGLPEIRSR